MDCNLESVDCSYRIDVDGRFVRTPSLRFTGPLDPPDIDLLVTATGEGRVRVEPAGLAPDSTWLALRDRDPTFVEGLPAFGLAVCASAADAVAPDAPAGTRWGLAVTGTENCDLISPLVDVDPDDPNAGVEVDLPRYLFGFAGRSDCGAVRCYLVISRATENEVVDGGVGGSEEHVVAAPLPAELAWPSTPLPALRVDAVGPDDGPTEIDVTISGLPVGASTAVGVCTADESEYCDIRFDGFGNGSHRIHVADPVEACAADECFLALFPMIKAAPPVAIAPLDAP